MKVAILERCINSISRWYFLEFYLFFYTKSPQEQHLLKKNFVLFEEAITEHYDLVKRAEDLRPGGFDHRKNKMYLLLSHGEMYNALIFIITHAKSQELKTRSQEVHTIVHGEPY
jgi:hypothetical protein